MEAKLKLLVIDNDHTEYDTLESARAAAARFEYPILWEVVLCSQDLALAQITEATYNAVLIDNDFGKGLQTFQAIKGYDIPTAYVSAYDSIGLMRQPEYKALFGDHHPISVGLLLLQKKGKNYPSTATKETLAARIHDFLESIVEDFED